MPPLLEPLLWLHILASGAVFGLAVARLARPADGRGARALDMAVALLAAAALPLASEGGWWIDMPAQSMVPAIAVLAFALAAFGTHRRMGRLAALALAAFFLTLGMASLRNGGPVAGFLAAKAILFGLMLLCLPPALRGAAGAVRWRTALLVVLLATATGLGVHKDLPLP